MDCSLPGSPVPGIFQARVLEWGAIAFSENSPYPKAKHTLGAAPGLVGLNAAGEIGVAPVCPPDVSPGPSLPAGRTSLQMRVLVYVCTFYLFPPNLSFVYLRLCRACSVRGLPAGAAGRLPSSAVRRVRGPSGWRPRPAARRLFPGWGRAHGPRAGRRLPHLRPQKPLVFLSPAAFLTVVKRARRGTRRSGPSPRASGRRPAAPESALAALGRLLWAQPSILWARPCATFSQHFLSDGFQLLLFFLRKAPLCRGNDFREMSSILLSGWTPFIHRRLNDWLFPGFSNCDESCYERLCVGLYVMRAHLA
nr:uncharacterized protein LOC105605744 [Ovis aries]